MTLHPISSDGNCKQAVHMISQPYDAALGKHFPMREAVDRLSSVHLTEDIRWQCLMVWEPRKSSV